MSSTRCRMPMNIQFFAESGGDGGNGNPQGGQAPPQDAPAGQQPPQIDYAKIQQMLEGTLAAKEDTALKAYFKQQGLSQQEAEQAMSAFKAEKAKNQPDVGARPVAEGHKGCADPERRDHGGSVPWNRREDGPLCP